MVKRTNYVHNLNKMILEYKREQEKFEVIKEEFCNQDKEIENLRQLILSTNFMNQNSVCSVRSSATGPLNSTMNSSTSSRGIRETTTKQLVKDLRIGQKAKVQSERSGQATSQQVDATDGLKAKQSTNQFKALDQSKDKSTRSESDRTIKTTDRQQTDRRPTNKSKGLQTINKNVLNQKDNKYLNDGDKFGKSGEPKKSDLVKRKTDASELIKPNKLHDDAPAINKSNELLSRISKLKSMNGHKFENQENPIKECLGINRTSKSINKKTRPVKSALKATKSSSSMNRIHLL